MVIASCNDHRSSLQNYAAEASMICNRFELWHSFRLNVRGLVQTNSSQVPGPASVRATLPLPHDTRTYEIYALQVQRSSSSLQRLFNSDGEVTLTMCLL